MGDHRVTDRAFSGIPGMGLADQDTWSGALSFLRRPYSKDATGADVVVSGVPYDLAVTNRPGTRFGPRAIRAASAGVAWEGGPWRWDFDPTEILKVIDWGDMSFDQGRPEGIPAEIEAQATALLESGAKLLTLGGDHFISHPLLKAHAARHGPLALLQFDSHSDTWREKAKRIDHGTMFFHAIQEGIIDSDHSVQIGIRSKNPESHGISIIDADEMCEAPVAELIGRIRDTIGDRPVYLSFDIDCLDPSAAPGTGTPVAGGPSTQRTLRLLSGLTDLDIVGADIVEVAPAYDHGEITALAAATIGLEILCLWANAARR